MTLPTAHPASREQYGDDTFMRTEWVPEQVSPVAPRREPLNVTIAKFDRIRLAVGVNAKQ